MDAHLTCPRGHRRPLPDAAASAVGSSPLVCPQCGPNASDSADKRPTVLLRPFRADPPDDLAPPHVAGYEIVREVGRGGMGVVYQAVQKTLNRVVALKMILGACRNRPQEHARFLAEAEVIASLQHPNIVQIHEIGEADGRPFFSLEYVEGGSLAGRLRGQPLPPRQAARLIAVVARAVDAAHRQGVVHRDLKPANILLAGGGPEAPIEGCTPKITDFGLAKRLDSGLQTTTGFILGTPCYMAPEQAAGKVDLIGPASDLYSLGAILYELLTGRPPFQGDTPLVTMQQVVFEDPVAPTQLQRQAPVDLETICLKCLQKEPKKRYSSAAALAEDLERYLDGRPVLARPATAGERLVKWTRRRPAMAAFVGVSVVALVLLMVGGAWHTLQLQEALSATNQARIDAQSERDASLLARRLAEERERLVNEYVYAVHVRQAGQFWDHADLRPMRELLAPYADPPGPDPREFTWCYLWRLCHGDRRTLEGHAEDVYCAVYSPDGAKLATTSRDHTIRLWDAATGRELRVLRGHDEEVNWAAFSPDGASLASVGDDGRVVLWEVETGAERRHIRESDDDVLAVAFAPDGALLATAGADRMIHLWDANNLAEAFTLPGHAKQVESLAFDPVSGLLASAAQDGRVIVWDVNKRSKVLELSCEGAAAQTVAWSRDGRLIAAACGDGAVRLWDADTGRPRPPLRGDVAEVQGVAFSPDGKTVACAGNDHVVRLWDAESGAPRNVLRGHGDRVWCVAFSPDGRTLVSASRDRTVKLWDPKLRQEWQSPPEPAGVTAVAVCVRRGLTAVGRGDGAIELQTADGRAPEVLPAQSQAATALTFSPDGLRLASQAADGTVVLWDLGERRPRVLRGGKEPRRSYLSFSDDGRTLASLATRETEGTPQFWDAATGDPSPSPVADVTDCSCLAYSPAEGLLALAGKANNRVLLYDLKAGRVRWENRGHQAPVVCMAFSADGRTLATGGMDKAAKLWDVGTGREKTGGLLGHADAISCVAFHPDGKTIATGGVDHTIRLWDAVTGQELATLPAHAGRVRTLAFTPDGGALLSAGAGPGDFRLWPAGPVIGPLPITAAR